MSKINRSSDNPKKPARKDWDHHAVLYAVRRTGTTLSVLSLQHGIGYGVLRNALYGPYPAYERLIAEHLGLKPQDIWPSRYHLDGTPKSGRGERGIGRYKRKTNSSTPVDSRNSQPVAAGGNLREGA